jgi:hypothetical protein
MRPVQYSADSILDPFYQHKILTREEHRELCGCSAMTAWRVLRQHGYLSSYNANARYYTLIDIPEFDDQGIWSYRGIRFSKFGSLNSTMVELITRSSQGKTAREIEAELGITNARTTLIKLHKEGKVSRTKVKGIFVYLAVDPERGERQRRLREAAMERIFARSDLPTSQKIIAVLVQWIVRPELRPDQIVRRLSRKGLQITRREILAIVEYYDLPFKKKFSLY